MSRFSATISEPWCVAGDFNSNRYVHEKVGGSPPNLTCLEQFDDCIENAGLQDLCIAGNTFSWSNSSEGVRRIECKLDRILVNSDFISNFSNSIACHLNPGLSDHSAILVKIPSEETKDLFSGGTETTSTTVEWAMAELLKTPNAMEKAQEEVRRVVGQKPRVQVEDLQQMDYLKCIIKETLRLHPLAPLLVPRESTQTATVQGYHIPPRTRVFVNVWAIARDPKLWKNADEFIPERFINSPIDFKGQDFEYLPFGAGRRGCPGMAFALPILELSLANLLYWFNWKLPDGASREELDMSESSRLAVHKKASPQLVPLQYHFS